MLQASSHRKRNWLAIGVVVVTAALALIVWQWRRGADPAEPLQERSSEQRKAIALATLQGKPVCPADANPLRGDCLPAYLAGLPPDPGKAGEATVAGVDSNNDGIRDDVEIFIAENYGSSERAVRALRFVAKRMQTDMIDPPTTPEQAVARAEADTSIACYVSTVDWEVRVRDALEEVRAQMVNTPERFGRFRAHDKLFAGMVQKGTDPFLTIEQICGYDPNALKN